MKLHDIGRYNEAKKKLEELEPIIKALDDVCDILYNNLTNARMFYLLDKAEEIRVDYYVQQYEYELVVKNKGKLNE